MGEMNGEAARNAGTQDATSNRSDGLRIWTALVATNLLLSILIAWYLGGGTHSLVCISGVAALLTTGFAAAPYARFFDHGWWTRHDEFRNLLWEEALSEYLWHFWHRRAEEVGALRRSVNGPEASESEAEKTARFASASTLFDRIYKEQYGLGAFGVPLGFLLLAIFLATHFAVFVGLTAQLPADGYVFQVIHALSPTLASLALSAICGAYLFVVGDSVDSIRRECLNISAVYWYVLRMLLAIPIAMSLTFELPSDAANAVAFALGAFPVNFILKQLRQLATGKLKAQPDEVTDQLIKLDGVTSPTVALLQAEGVTSIDQLLGIDPVLLSIHTGLPFRSILRLCSQAIVRRHFGDAAFALSALGLADAAAIYCLVRELRADSGHAGPDWTVLEDASSVLSSLSDRNWPQKEAVRFAFENIASFAYTHFLMAAGFERAPRQAARSKPGKHGGAANGTADGRAGEGPQANHANREVPDGVPLGNANGGGGANAGGH